MSTVSHAEIFFSEKITKGNFTNEKEFNTPLKISVMNPFSAVSIIRMGSPERPWTTWEKCMREKQVKHAC